MCEMPIGRFVTHDHLISAFERDEFAPGIAQERRFGAVGSPLA